MMTVTSFPAWAASASALDDGGVAAGAVQRLLDGQHLRIVGRLFDEIHDRAKTLEGMVQEDVARAQCRKDIAAHPQAARERWV